MHVLRSPVHDTLGEGSTMRAASSLLISYREQNAVCLNSSTIQSILILCIPNYRDYRTGSDDFTESKHHRKESKARPGGLSRELRQLDLSLDEDGHLERRRSVGSGSNSGFDSKRRGRPPRQQPAAPKLKIKIGSTNSIVGRIDDKRDRIRPPKKRIATISLPSVSVEDLKRESMKFRKKVMQDLKIKKKKDKSEKRKRKKLKSEVQIINQGGNPTKLIFRFGKKGDGERTSGETVDERTEPQSVSDGSPMKVTPIKLKLSRCQEGSGYVMKAEEAQAGQPPPEPPPEQAPPPVAPAGGCEVR